MGLGLYLIIVTLFALGVSSYVMGLWIPENSLSPRTLGEWIGGAFAQLTPAILIAVPWRHIQKRKGVVTNTPFIVATIPVLIFAYLAVLGANIG